MTLRLDSADQAMLDGEHGPGVVLAMRVLSRVAEAMDAERLLDISGAHIDSCIYFGQSAIDFATRLVDAGATVAVPSTLNVSSIDLLHPERYQGDPEVAAQSRLLTELYESMGCRPTWTCAPYQLPERPGFGDHVGWGESNAIAFANSVLGARTHRYGDFIDICLAITGRAPAAGLHLDENRRAEVVFELTGISDELLNSDALAPALGYHIGHVASRRVAAIVGLPADTPEHRLKAIGGAAASSGAVGMFHAVGITPEAPTLAAAVGDFANPDHHIVGPDELRAARNELSNADPDAPLGAVSLGTPHYSMAEFDRLIELLGGRRVSAGVVAYVNTGRDIWHEVSLRGWDITLAEAGFEVVTDTCTYVAPMMATFDGSAMTDSAKWAHYAPGNMGFEVVFGSVDECVESAVAGRVMLDDAMWAGS